MIKKITITVLAVGLIVAFSWVFFMRDTTSIDQGNQTNPFPDGSTNTSRDPNTPNEGDATLSIKTTDDGMLQVKNFSQDTDTVADPNNKGTYYLGNHFPFDGSVSTQSPEYVITYIPATQYFNISLFSEPIGTSRVHAEEYLLQHLGVSKEQLCRLNYMVSVPYFVNQFYTSKDLRFSFCPEGVPL